MAPDGAKGMHVDLPTMVFVIAVVAFLSGVCSDRLRANFAWQAWSKGRTREHGVPFNKSSDLPILDSDSQLRVVMDAQFEKRPLLSRTEARVLYAAEKAIRDLGLEWR